MAALDLKSHGRRAETFQVFRDQFVDALRRLVRHETEREFRARPGGDDRLAAFALITAGQAVDLERRSRGALFLRGVAALAEHLRDTEEFPISRFVKRNPGQLFSLVSGERNNVGVKTRNGDTAIFVAQAGQQLAQGHGRVVHRTAVDAGVQIARRALRFDLHRADAAQGVGQRRMFQVRDAGVGNHDGVTTEFIAVFPQKRRETLAANFLLTFDDKGQVAAQRRVRFQVRLDGFEVGEVLAFVIAGAAGEERAAFDARLERRRFPKLERFGGLNVVMAVNQKV